MKGNFSAPGLSFLFSMELELEEAQNPGVTPKGQRRIVRVSGGKFQGEKLTGVVLPGGDDWITIHDDGTIIQDVRILLQTDDQALILMTYRGIRTGPSEVLERLNRQEEVNPEDYYFRTSPIFEAANPNYNWLNKRVFIGKGARLPNTVFYSIFTVD